MQLAELASRLVRVAPLGKRTSDSNRASKGRPHTRFIQPAQARCPRRSLVLATMRSCRSAVLASGVRASSSAQTPGQQQIKCSRGQALPCVNRLTARNGHRKRLRLFRKFQARSSVVEHYIDTVGVGSSILPAPTAICSGCPPVKVLPELAHRVARHRLVERGALASDRSAVSVHWSAVSLHRSAVPILPAPPVRGAASTCSVALSGSRP